MKQELILTLPQYGPLTYHPAISGQIELVKLTGKLSILILYFQKLRITDKPKEMYSDESVEVMLTNFPVSVSSLSELDDKEFFIKNGFTGPVPFTMLSIYDGEPINNSRIKFKLLKPDCFEIDWTGCWGEDNYDNENFKLHMVAYQENDIVTPLCEHDKDLIVKFEKN